MGKLGPTTPMLITLLEAVDDTSGRGHQGFLEVIQGGSPSFRGRSSDRKSDQSSVHLAEIRASHNSHRPVCEGKGLFEDEKTNHAVTYHSC